MKQYITLIFLLIFFAIPAHAAISPWEEGAYSKTRLVTGGEENGQYYAGVEIQAESGWKMYWRTPGDAGFPPIFDWSGSHNAHEFNVKWPAPLRQIEHYEGSKLESYVYHDKVFFPVFFKPENAANPQHIRLKLDYGVCKEICIPVSAEFSLDIPAQYQDNEALAQIKAALKKIPQANGEASITITHHEMVQKGKQLYLAVQAESTRPFHKPDMLIETQSMYYFAAPEVEYKDDTHAIFYAEAIPTVKTAPALQGSELHVTLINGDDAVESTIVAAPASHGIAESSSSSMVALLWLAFLGGLILNVMPCVLPVLSIKLLTILQQGGVAHHAVRRSFITSALGIIVSFIGLAVITIGVKASGQAVGWGFHFQNPTFLIVLVVILVLFSSNLMGRFEINLPGGIADFLINKTPMKHQGQMGDFMAGVFATILATPCSAPFLGTAVSFALSRGAVDILIIFSVMGIGLAFPYLLFSIFPQWVSRLPKPGMWMIKIRYLLALLLALTALWLLWVLSNSLGIKAAIVVFLSLLLIKFFIELKGRALFRIIGVALVLAVVFTIPPIISRQDMARSQLASDIWQVFDEAAIPELVAEGKVVFVDITADWCLTCKFNKLVVLGREDIIRHFKSEKIIAMQADITKPNPAILTYLKKHGRYGIPFNIVYGPGAPEGIALSELLSTGEVKRALQQAKTQKHIEKE